MFVTGCSKHETAIHEEVVNEQVTDLDEIYEGFPIKPVIDDDIFEPCRDKDKDVEIDKKYAYCVINVLNESSIEDVCFQFSSWEKKTSHYLYRPYGEKWRVMGMEKKCYALPSVYKRVSNPKKGYTSSFACIIENKEWYQEALIALRFDDNIRLYFGAYPDKNDGRLCSDILWVKKDSPINVVIEQVEINGCFITFNVKVIDAIHK